MLTYLLTYLLISFLFTAVLGITSESHAKHGSKSLKVQMLICGLKCYKDIQTKAYDKYDKYVEYGCDLEMWVR